jgi:hypothetical protein
MIAKSITTAPIPIAPEGRRSSPLADTSTTNVIPMRNEPSTTERVYRSASAAPQHAILVECKKWLPT